MATTMPAAQFDVWARMRAESHPWLAIVKRNADYDATSPRYASYGRWSGLYYLMSGGEAQYGASCYAAFAANCNNFQTPMRPGNSTREHGIESTLLLDWIRPTLTPEQIATWTNWLIATADGVMAAGLRLVDSDQVSGTFCFLAVLDHVCGTDYLTRDIRDTGTKGTVPLGGLTSTACDRSTVRNCLTQYIQEMGHGGQWIESWEYNLGTPCLVFMGWLSLLTAHGRDYLPEFAAWLEAARRYHYHEVAPSRTQAFQWGDVQASHSLHWPSRDTLYAFLRRDDPPFEAFCQEMDTANARTLPTSSTPLYARWYYYADPYAAATDWQTPTPTHHVTPGTGHAYWRTDWRPTAKATHFMCTAYSVGGYVDHLPNVHGHIQVARGDQFLLDYVVGYSASPQCYNQLLICGGPPSREAGALTEAAAEAGVFAYAAGTNCGMGLGVTTYYPPPTYLHELTRSVFELLDGDATVLVIVDRVHTDDPRTQLRSNGLPAIDRYPAAVQTQMQAALGLKDLLFHTPVAPELTGRGFTWLVPNTAMRAEVRQVLPVRDLTYTVVDERGLSLGTISDKEKKFCVHMIAPADDVLPSFEVFLTVLLGSEADLSTIETTAVETTEVVGVRVQRPDAPDVIVACSARPGPIVTYDQANLEVVATARRLDASFTLVVPAPATVYLCDLEPAVTWAATCDGHPVPLTWIGSLARVVCAAAGALTCYANDTPPEPPEPPVTVPEWTISEQSAGRIVLERITDRRRRLGRL